MIVNGFCKQVFRELPMEFAVEAQKLLGVSAKTIKMWERTKILIIKTCTGGLRITK